MFILRQTKMKKKPIIVRINEHKQTLFMNEKWIKILKEPEGQGKNLIKITRNKTNFGKVSPKHFLSSGIHRFYRSVKLLLNRPISLYISFSKKRVETSMQKVSMNRQ